MSNPNDFDRVVVTEEPVVVQREEVIVRERSNSAWWIAALVFACYFALIRDESVL